MSDPIRRSPLAQQLNRQGAVHVQALSEDVECVAWKGPVGNLDKNGVPSAWSPGFIFDAQNGLEAIIIPKVIVKIHKLSNAYGFWGAKPKDPEATTIQEVTAVTTTDDAPTDTVGKPLTKNTLSRLRDAQARIISEYATRVRIVGLDPDTITYPRAEEWEVLAIGMYPANVRFGLLIPIPDPTGSRWQVGTGTVAPGEHVAAQDKLTTAPQGAAGPIEASVNATKAAAGLEESKTGSLKQGGGFPAEGTTHRKGVDHKEEIDAAAPGEPDPAAICDT